MYVSLDFMGFMGIFRNSTESPRYQFVSLRYPFGIIGFFGVPSGDPGFPLSPQGYQEL